MGCSESTHYKSSLEMTSGSTRDTNDSPNKTVVKKNNEITWNFVDFDTYEDHQEKNVCHIYDFTLQKALTVPILQNIEKSTILRRRNKQY